MYRRQTNAKGQVDMGTEVRELDSATARASVESVAWAVVH